MSYITRQRVNEITSELRNEIARINGKILETDAKLASISFMANSTYHKYQGKVVANSISIDRSRLDEDGHGAISADFSLFNIINTDPITAACKKASDELNELREPLDQLSKSSTDIDEVMEIIAVYINKVEEELFPGDTSRSYLQKMRIAIDYYMKNDFENDYDILYSTPILEQGDLSFTIVSGIDENGDSIHEAIDVKNCSYYKFFNRNGIDFIAPVGMIDANGNFVEYENGTYKSTTYESSGNSVIKVEYDAKFSELDLRLYTMNYKKIMNHSKVYSDKFNQYATDNVKQVTFINNMVPDRNTLAHITYSTNGITIYKDANSASLPVEDTYTHELGHVFDYYYDKESSTKWFSEDDRWRQVQQELNSIDTSAPGAPIRSYAQEDPKDPDPLEGFAEMVAEYYGESASSGSIYDPEDLKRINVGEMTLYDIMEQILDKEVAK